MLCREKYCTTLCCATALPCVSITSIQQHQAGRYADIPSSERDARITRRGSCSPKGQHLHVNRSKRERKSRVLQRPQSFRDHHPEGARGRGEHIATTTQKPEPYTHGGIIAVFATRRAPGPPATPPRRRCEARRNPARTPRSPESPTRRRRPQGDGQGASRAVEEGGSSTRWWCVDRIPFGR